MYKQILVHHLLIIEVDDLEKLIVGLLVRQVLPHTVEESELVRVASGRICGWERSWKAWDERW